MPTYDFLCQSCKKIDADVFYRVADLPERVKCQKCSGEMRQTYLERMGQINPKGSMYGRYHIGFGEVVESYSHKQALLKKYDVTESSDPVNGSRSWRDQVKMMPEASKEKAQFLTDAEVKEMLR